jgi:tetratricopeptide (TPR) repeat protein
MSYEYIQAVIEAIENGMEYAEVGLPRLADSLYGTAASSLCALRYAAACLLGEADGNGRFADWDIIASMGWKSPAAYFFEGLVHEAQGRTDNAADCYAKASVNPYFTDGDEFKGIASLSGDNLRRLRDEAARVEGEIFKLYEPVYSTAPRHEKNYDPVYLAEQAAACLKQDEPDMAGALAYYRAALSVNPFSGYNYAGLVVVYMAMGDGETAEAYLKEGLIIDPTDKTLNALIDKLEEVTKQ